MTVSELYEKGLINDRTNLTILSDSDAHFTKGQWFQDALLNQMKKTVTSFSCDFERNEMRIFIKEDLCK